MSELEQAFEAGWRTAANWMERDDLIADIGSPAYLADCDAAIAAPPARAPECVIVCQQSVDCGSWPNMACEQRCGQAERAAQAEPATLETFEEWRDHFIKESDHMPTLRDAWFAALAARGAQAGDAPHSLYVARSAIESALNNTPETVHVPYAYTVKQADTDVEVIFRRAAAPAPAPAEPPEWFAHG